MTLMPRDVAARLGHETLQILRVRSYQAPSGRVVDLGAGLDAAAQGTVEYPPERQLTCAPGRGPQPSITVENESVLSVGRRMSATGPVAALNFASATAPGGGFLTGARAQEESIARSSGLFHCLDGRQMYARHRAVLDAMYSDYVIYSPAVPVFRDDSGRSARGAVAALCLDMPGRPRQRHRTVRTSSARRDSRRDARADAQGPWPSPPLTVIVASSLAPGAAARSDSTQR